MWELYEKTHNIIDTNGNRNRAKTGASAVSSFSRALFSLDTFSLPSKTSKFWRQNFLWNLRGVALKWEVLYGLLNEVAL